MSSVASRAILIVLMSAVTASTVCADPLPSVQAADESVPAQETDENSDEVRRDIMRIVARVSLCLILVLIIFVVSLMIASRRFRVWARGWNRKIGFGKLQDLWWQGPEKDGSPKKKPREK